MSAGEASAAGAQGAASGSGGEEQRLRAAYEAELARITSAELLLQSAAALLNHAARRLGLAGGGGATDHGQARDAIDGVRALMPVIERACPTQQAQALREALSQLQLAFAGAVKGGAEKGAKRDASAGAQAGAGAGAGTASEAGRTKGAPGAGPDAQAPGRGGERERGPAERSGRLWVPGSS